MKEFKECKSWKFVKNEAPNGFKKEASDFGLKIVELDYENKFERIIKENPIEGRNGKKTIKYNDTNYKWSELRDVMARDWYKAFLEEVQCAHWEIYQYPPLSKINKYPLKPTTFYK